MSDVQHNPTKATCRCGRPDCPHPSPEAWRIELDDDGQMDELFARNATVHIERMSESHVWIRVNDQVVNIASKTGAHLLVMTEDDRA